MVVYSTSYSGLTRIKSRKFPAGPSKENTSSSPLEASIYSIPKVRGVHALTAGKKISEL
jgi:hypothetical protein